MGAEKQIDVMVVEDNDAHAELIHRALATWTDPVRIRRAKDGQSAVDQLVAMTADPAAQRRLPDLILLDLKLPGMSGIAVLDRIKADTLLRHIPVITLTSSQAPTDVAAAYGAHANSYLVKPIGFRQFCATLKGVHSYWVERNTSSPVISTH